MVSERLTKVEVREYHRIQRLREKRRREQRALVQATPRCSQVFTPQNSWDEELTTQFYDFG